MFLWITCWWFAFTKPCYTREATVSHRKCIALGGRHLGKSADKSEHRSKTQHFIFGSQRVIPTLWDNYQGWERGIWSLGSYPRITTVWSWANYLTSRSWSWIVLWRPTRPSRTNTPKWCPFHYMGLGCKSRKSRNTWSDGQIWPWSTEWSRAKANRVLPREHTGHSKHPLPITQEKSLHMDITRWSIPKSDWLYSLQPKMEKLYTVSTNKTRSPLCFRSWTPYCKNQT